MIVESSTFDFNPPSDAVSSLFEDFDFEPFLVISPLIEDSENHAISIQLDSSADPTDNLALENGSAERDTGASGLPQPNNSRMGIKRRSQGWYNVIYTNSITDEL